MSRRIGIATAIWAIGILLSRVIGLVREAAFGRIVGGGQSADLYQAAFTIPDFLNYLLAAGALSVVFIPLFSRYLEQGDEKEGWRAFSSIATSVGLLMLGLTVMAWFLVPTVNAAWFAGFDEPSLRVLNQLTYILLPAQIFHVTGGLLSAALQAKDRHALPAMAPLVYTLCIILGGLSGVYDGNPFGFAWGVLIGSILGPFGLPLLGCWRMGLQYRPRIDFDHDLRTYFIQSLPIMLAFSVIVVDDWLLKGVAAGMQEGAVATVTFAKQIMRVPMGVFGLALGAAAYPTLARLVASGENDQAYRTLDRALRQMLCLALGAQVVLTVAGADIAKVIYGSKLLENQHSDIGSALSIFALALWAWSAHTVLARGFYARGQTWIPSVVGTVVIVLTWPLYRLLAGYFGTDGLAMASSAGVGLYVLVLGIWLRRSHSAGIDQFIPFFFRITPAVAIAIASGWGLSELSQRILGGPIAGVMLDYITEWPAAAEISALVGGGIIGGASLSLYVLLLFALKVPGFQEVTALIISRVRRT